MVSTITWKFKEQLLHPQCSGLTLGKSESTDRNVQCRNAKKAHRHRDRAQGSLQTSARKLTFVSKIIFISRSKLLVWKREEKKNLCEKAAFAYIGSLTFSSTRVPLYYKGVVNHPMIPVIFMD